MASAASGTCHALTATRTTSTAPMFGRIVGDPGGMNDEVAVYAADPQPVLPDRVQVPPAGDELHVLPGLRQSATEVPADGAGSEDCDSKIAH